MCLYLVHAPTHRRASPLIPTGPPQQNPTARTAAGTHSAQAPRGRSSGCSTACPAPRAPPGEGPAWSWYPHPRGPAAEEAEGRERAGALPRARPAQGLRALVGGGRLPPGGLHPCPGVTARSATLPHSVRVRKVRWQSLCRPVPPSLCPAATRRARRMVGPCP